MVFACKTAAFGSEILVSIGPRPPLSFCPRASTTYGSRLGFCMQNIYFWIGITSLYGAQASQNNVISIRALLCFLLSLYLSQPSSVVFCMQNSVISTRNTSLRESQTSPVVLCMQNNVVSITLVYWSLCAFTNLYGSQPSFVVLACKTTTLGPRITGLYGSQTSPMYFFVFKTAPLCISTILVSMGIASLNGSQHSFVV